MAINDPNVVYIPNVRPSWISIRGDLAAVKVPWDIPNKRWDTIYCFADDIVEGDHPAVVDVSQGDNKALELFVNNTYTVHAGYEVGHLSGIGIARTILSEEELKRQGSGPVGDGGGGDGGDGEGSAAAAVLELELEPEPDEAYKNPALDDVTYNYLRELRKWQSQLEEDEPELEEDEPEFGM